MTRPSLLVWNSLQSFFSLACLFQSEGWQVVGQGWSVTFVSPVYRSLAGCFLLGLTLIFETGPTDCGLVCFPLLGVLSPLQSVLVEREGF